MAKNIDISEGFLLKDILAKDGVTLQFDGECLEDEEEEFSFNPNVHLTNEEALNMLNMEQFEDDREEKDEGTSFMPCATSFETLKLKAIDISGNGKVLKLMKREGVGEVVTHNAQVTMHYIGYFEYRDEPFDSTFIRGVPRKARLHDGELILGLEMGLSTMRKHEIAIFIVHPDLAFGELGCPPRVPPNEEVLFVVHLLDFLDNGSADTYENLNAEERKIFSNIVKSVNDMLLTAKETFRREKTKQAVREYKKAVAWLENADLKSDGEEAEMNKLLSKAYSNLAVCYNKLDMPRRACISCNSVPIKSAKSHFNHGRALLKMGEYSRAMQELQIAHSMEPGNKFTIKEIQLVNEKERQYREMTKSLWKNCLNETGGAQDESKFRAAARNMCETFNRDANLFRYPLPEGLTPEEEKYVREEAAALGLSVTSHTRYDKEVVYLNKPNY